MIPYERYTPVERKILQLLSDGRPHTRHELKTCLDDELSDIKAIKPHMTRLRKKIRPKGEDILCTFGNRRSICYQHVRILANPNDGAV